MARRLAPWAMSAMTVPVVDASRLARPAGGREQDAVDRRRLVAARVPGDQRPQLGEQDAGARRGRVADGSAIALMGRIYIR